MSLAFSMNVHRECKMHRKFITIKDRKTGRAISGPGTPTSASKTMRRTSPNQTVKQEDVANLFEPRKKRLTKKMKDKKLSGPVREAYKESLQEMEDFVQETKNMIAAKAAPAKSEEKAKKSIATAESSNQKVRTT